MQARPSGFLCIITGAADYKRRPMANATKICRSNNLYETNMESRKAVKPFKEKVQKMCLVSGLWSGSRNE